MQGNVKDLWESMKKKFPPLKIPVAISVIAGSWSIIERLQNISAKMQLSDILFASLPFVSGLACGVFCGIKWHYANTGKVLRVRTGQYDKQLEFLSHSKRIDMLAINFAGFFNFRKYVESAIITNGATVRILLLESESEAFRAYCGKDCRDENAESELRGNQKKAIQTICDISRKALGFSITGHKPGSISYEFFDSLPYRGLIISDSVVRYWPYLEHCHPSSSPTYEVSRDGEIGIALEEEFNKIWNKSIQRREMRGWEVRKIISGGQTGVDRAALDWAIEKGIEHGGTCPDGRLAEDGIIDGKYQLEASGTNEDRTKKNVEDSDGTIILSDIPELVGGTALTLEHAQKKQKPWILVLTNQENSGERVYEFLTKHRIQCLNIAGPRESQAKFIGNRVKAMLDEALSLAKASKGASWTPSTCSDRL